MSDVALKLPALVSSTTNCKVTFTATLPIEAYSVEEVQAFLNVLKTKERLENLEIQNIEYETFSYLLYPELDSNIKAWFCTALAALTGVFIGITLLMSIKYGR